MLFIKRGFPQWKFDQQWLVGEVNVWVGKRNLGRALPVDVIVLVWGWWNVTFNYGREIIGDSYLWIYDVPAYTLCMFWDTLLRYGCVHLVCLPFVCMKTTVWMKLDWLIANETTTIQCLLPVESSVDLLCWSSCLIALYEWMICLD